MPRTLCMHPSHYLSSRTRQRVLLGGLAVVVFALAVHAGLAVHSRHDLARKVLRDHVAAALWYFEQNLEGELNNVLECAFHEALHVSDAGNGATLRIGEAHGVLPAAHIVLDRWYFDSTCGRARLPRPQSAFRFGPGAAVDIAGAAVSDVVVEDLRVLLATGHAATPVRRTDGVAAGRVGGDPVLVLYSRQRDGAGEAQYAVVLDAASVAAIGRSALRDFRLLPPPVVGESDVSGLMRIALLVEDSAIFNAGGNGPAAASSSRVLAQSLGGLIARGEVTPAGAALLAEAPASRSLPWLLLLLAASLAILGMTYRQMRREHEFTRLRDDFVASVSHELRTPLALQRILLDTLKTGRAESANRRAWALDHIDRETRRLEQLVGNILHFTRAKGSALSTAPAVQSVFMVVERSVEAVRPLAEQRKAEIHIHGEADLEAAIDDATLHQAICNVIDNALKYGPEGQRIDVAVSRVGEMAEISVADEGPGVPPEERAAVLEAYRRGSAVRGGPVAGSGIGLAVVRDVMRAHGGAVTLTAADRGGLRVLLSLPAAASAGSAGTGPVSVPAGVEVTV